MFLKQMAMVEKEKIVHNLVEWCLDRTEMLSDEADVEAMMQEFNEWFLYENGEVMEFDFLSFTVKN